MSFPDASLVLYKFFLAGTFKLAVTGIQPAVIESLRAQVNSIERPGQITSKVTALPFGVMPINRHLPTRGLLLGAVHELQGVGPDVETSALSAVFAAGALARRPEPVIRISRSGGMFAHGLLQAGFDPRRLVFVDAGRSVLLVVEEASRHPEVAGVVCKLDSSLSLTTSRRLQLTAEGS